MTLWCPQHKGQTAMAAPVSISLQTTWQGPAVPDTLWSHFALSKDLAPLGVSADQGVQVSRPWTRAQTSSDWIRAWDTFPFTLSRLAGHLCPRSILQVHSLPLGDTHWEGTESAGPQHLPGSSWGGKKVLQGGSRQQAPGSSPPPLPYSLCTD